MKKQEVRLEVGRSEIVKEATSHGYYQAEAKKAFEQRDLAKDEAREAKEKLARFEEKEARRNGLMEEAPLWEKEERSLNWFLGLCFNAEKKDMLLVRMDGPAELIRLVKGWGRSVYDECTHRETMSTGIMFHVGTCDIYLNNHLPEGKVRLYYQKIMLQEFAFPA